MNNFNEARDAGVQFVYVGPSYNATAAYFEARWVRCCRHRYGLHAGRVLRDDEQDVWTTTS